MSTDKPTIVAIIPLYNGAPWIAAAIKSVWAQTWPPDEIIVVDDGSTDDNAGADIVRQLNEEHPVTLLTKSNGGQSSARNLAVAYSTGDLLAFLDQDDIWHPHHLETLVRPFLADRPVTLGWTYSNVDLIDETGRMITRRFLSDLPTEHPKRHLARCLAEDMHVLPSASLISREAFDLVGGFDERLRGYEDDDLFLRLFSAGFDNVYIDEALSQWRMSLGSCGHSHIMCSSGLVYMNKLLEQFPTDESVGHYYWRDAIAPRFVHALMERYRTAVRDHNVEQRRDVVAGLRRIVPMLPAGHTRRMLSAALPMLESNIGPLILFRALPLARRIYRAAAGR